MQDKSDVIRQYMLSELSRFLFDGLNICLVITTAQAKKKPKKKGHCSNHNLGMDTLKS